MNKPIIFKVTRTPKGLDNRLDLAPTTAANTYCAVINVSDSPCASFDYQLFVPSFWFPVNEVGKWGHSPFYGALRVVNHYWKGGLPVLIHCHAGANRSPSIAYAILLAKGYTVEEAEESLQYESLDGVFKRNIVRKHIPENVVDFLKEADTSDGAALHDILQRMDALYAEWSNKKMGEQMDYTLTGDSENQARLVYDKVTKRFVVKKD